MGHRIVSEISTSFTFPDKLDDTIQRLREQGVSLVEGDGGTAGEKQRGKEILVHPVKHNVTGEVAYGFGQDTFWPLDHVMDSPDFIIGKPIAMEDVMAHRDKLLRSMGLRVEELPKGEPKSWGEVHMDRAASLDEAHGRITGTQEGYSIEHATKVAAVFNGMTPERVLASHPDKRLPGQKASRRKQWVTYDGIMMRDLEDDQIDAFLAITKRLEAKQAEADAEIDLLKVKVTSLRANNLAAAHAMTEMNAEIAALRAAAPTEAKPSDAETVARALKW